MALNVPPVVKSRSKNETKSIQGFPRVTTRPAGRVTWCSKCHGSGRVRKCSNSHGSGQEVLKSRRSGQVGSRLLQISRVGSGQEVTKISRVGSGHDPREAGHSRVGPALPVSCFRLTRGSDPRIRPADPTLESLPALLPKGFSRTNTQ